MHQLVVTVNHRHNKSKAGFSQLPGGKRKLARLKAGVPAGVHKSMTCVRAETSSSAEFGYVCIPKWTYDDFCRDYATHPHKR